MLPAGKIHNDVRVVAAPVVIIADWLRTNVPIWLVHAPECWRAGDVFGGVVAVYEIEGGWVHGKSIADVCEYIRHMLACTEWVVEEGAESLAGLDGGGFGFGDGGGKDGAEGREEGFQLGFFAGITAYDAVAAVFGDSSEGEWEDDECEQLKAEPHV